MHHFPFHVADIDHATARLTMEEFGCLVRLWMAYLKAEAGPSSAPSDLDFVTGARTSSERRSLQAVIKRFFSEDEGKKILKSLFCEDIIADYRASGTQSRYANLCRHWAKANKDVKKPTFEQFSVNPDSWFEEDTGRVRKVTGRNLLVLTSESEDSPNLPPPPSQPKTSNQEPITIGSPIVPKGTGTAGLPTMEEAAEAIYGLYPRKVAKQSALKAIVKVLKAGKITELALQDRVRAYAAATDKWEKQDRTFIPHPATWFNRGSYEDDPATWIREPAEDAKKKKGGAAVETPAMFAMGSSAPQGAPAGWKTAMFELWGAKWREFYAAFETMPPADQRQVRAWLEKKGPGAFECPVPCDWQTVWADMITDRECPETWADVCADDRRAIVERRKEADTGEIIVVAGSPKKGKSALV